MDPIVSDMSSSSPPSTHARRVEPDRLTPLSRQSPPVDVAALAGQAIDAMIAVTDLVATARQQGTEPDVQDLATQQ
jgi:hypothetical protein